MLLNIRMLISTLRRTAWMKWITADGETVAVAGNLPYGQLGIGGLDAGGDGGRTSMDGAHSVSVHVVVWKAGTAADSGDHGCLVRRHAKLGHCLVEHIEDGVVAAAGTPAGVLRVLKSEGANPFVSLFSILMYLMYKGIMSMVVHVEFHSFHHFLHQEGLSFHLVDAENLLCGEVHL